MLYNTQKGVIMKKFWRGYTKDGGIISEALGAKWDECKKYIGGM